jgi:hypothetical protein
VRFSHSPQSIGKKLAAFVAHKYRPFYSMPTASALSVGCPGQRALVPKSYPND